VSFKTLSRVTATQEVLLRTWHVLTTLTPDEFETFRAQVGKNDASGFQSYQYRHLEFLLGLKGETTYPQLQEDGGWIKKSVDVVVNEGSNPRPKRVIERLQRARNSPSLYDAIVQSPFETCCS
jgi:tryptophan 2,3-dioxygenase